MHLFGTDGVRGTAKAFPIRPVDVSQICRLAVELGANGQGLVIVGRDTRDSGELLVAAVMAGIAQGGASALDVGIVPTPAVSYLVRHHKAVLGVVVTASHNGPDDNGLKFFTGDGAKIGQALEAEIERSFVLTDRPHPFKGPSLKDPDQYINYIDWLKSCARPAATAGLNLVVDCGNGATHAILPKVLSDLGHSVHAIFAAPNGTNINHTSGSTHPQRLAHRVLAEGADLGIAVDGDGDRLVIVSPSGDLLDGDALLFLRATAALREQGDSRPVVGTVMSNLGLEIALQERQISFIRTDVGDRNVSQMLDRCGGRLGGEPSGHLIDTHFAPTSDATLNTLLLVNILQESGATLVELMHDFIQLPQAHRSVPEDMVSITSTQLDVIGLSMTTTLGTSGRCVIRRSGSEPVWRIMVEHRELDEAVRVADQCAHSLVAGA